MWKIATRGFTPIKSSFYASLSDFEALKIMAYLFTTCKS
jgi:hypothetical protein